MHGHSDWDSWQFVGCQSSHMEFTWLVALVVELQYGKENHCHDAMKDNSKNYSADNSADDKIVVW